MNLKHESRTVIKMLRLLVLTLFCCKGRNDRKLKNNNCKIYAQKRKYKANCLISSVHQLKEKKIVKTLCQKESSGTELFQLNFQPFLVCFLCVSKKNRVLSLR